MRIRKLLPVWTIALKGILREWQTKVSEYTARIGSARRFQPHVTRASYRDACFIRVTGFGQFLPRETVCQFWKNRKRDDRGYELQATYADKI